MSLPKRSPSPRPHGQRRKELRTILAALVVGGVIAGLLALGLWLINRR